MKLHHSTASMLPVTTAGGAPVSTIPGLLHCHLQELRASGLSDETIREAGIYSETDAGKLSALLGRTYRPKQGAALVFPFGEGYYRIKPSRPRMVQGKPVKYESPKGERNRAYFPPGVAALGDDPAGRLFYTEGEKKSLKLTQEGYSCVGLVGVYGWKPKGQERLLIELEQWAWSGREVYIVFDSDIAEKPDVLQAESRLAAALQSRGAKVKCVRLPHGPAGKDGKPTKQGADDYLVAHGRLAFQKLVEEAIDPEPLEPIEEKSPAKLADPASEAERMLKSGAKDGIPTLAHHRGACLQYGAGAWREIPPAELRAKVVRHLNRDYFQVTTGVTGNVLDQVRALSMIGSHIEQPSWIGPPPRDWQPTECLVCKNGIIHLPSLVEGKKDYLLPPTPRLFTPTALGFDFAIDAPEPVEWFRFLDSLWNNDAQSIELLQDWFGYCLTGDTSQQKILALIGPPRSGKGTICRVQRELVGPANVAGPTLASFAQNFGLQPLLGKSLAIVSDARLSGKTDQAVIVERLLSISGEDALSVDRKFQEPVTGKLPARLMIVSNELPRLADASGALSSRMLLLRMTESFAHREDTALTSKLLTELPGILLWAIQGWQRLRERGRFVQPDSALEMLADLRDLSSPIGRFVRECCVIEVGHETPVDDLYRAWCEWCEAEGRRNPGDKQGFGRNLQAAFSTIQSRQRGTGASRYRVYEGIGLAI